MLSAIVSRLHLLRCDIDFIERFDRDIEMLRMNVSENGAMTQLA